jgi:hypothetical protein
MIYLFQEQHIAAAVYIIVFFFHAPLLLRYVVTMVSIVLLACVLIATGVFDNEQLLSNPVVVDFKYENGYFVIDRMFLLGIMETSVNLCSTG